MSILRVSLGSSLATVGVSVASPRQFSTMREAANSRQGSTNTIEEDGIDTSVERKPQANIDKGLRIQNAALAPPDPSPQDYDVAAMGRQLEEQGRNEQVTAGDTSTDSRMPAHADTEGNRKQVDVYA